jgi:hypothetical protein
VCNFSRRKCAISIVVDTTCCSVTRTKYLRDRSSDLGAT